MSKHRITKVWVDDTHVYAMTEIGLTAKSECNRPTTSPVAALMPLLIASYIPWSGSLIIFEMRFSYSLIISTDDSVDVETFIYFHDFCQTIYSK